MNRPEERILMGWTSFLEDHTSSYNPVDSKTRQRHLRHGTEPTKVDRSYVEERHEVLGCKTWVRSSGSSLPWVRDKESKSFLECTTSRNDRVRSRKYERLNMTMVNDYVYGREETVWDPKDPRPEEDGEKQKQVVEKGDGGRKDGVGRHEYQLV